MKLILQVSELKPNDLKLQVVNLQFSCCSEDEMDAPIRARLAKCAEWGPVWRTGDDLFLLYRLHSQRHPALLCPSFPPGLLGSVAGGRRSEDQDVALLLERCAYFARVWSGMCSDELAQQEEFWQFLDPSIETLVYPEGTDVDSSGVPPPREWFPATSLFIRHSLSRLRRRSPSPHLDLDRIEQQEVGFANERRLGVQRMRRAALKLKAGKSLDMYAPANDIEVNYCGNEVRKVEQRRLQLQTSLKSLNAFANSVLGCQMLLEDLARRLSMNDDSSDDEDEDEDEDEPLLTGREHEDVSVGRKDAIPNSVNAPLKCPGSLFEGCWAAETDSVATTMSQLRNSCQDCVIDPLAMQMEDLQMLVGPLNARTELLRRLDDALTQRALTIEKLVDAHEPDQGQSKSDFEAEAETRSVGYQSRMASESSRGLRLAAHNSEMERRIEEVRRTQREWDAIDLRVSRQLGAWEAETDAFLLKKLVQLTSTMQ